VTTPTYEQAREALALRLTKKSLAHCERVAETAVGLARRCGVDVEQARLAGLLHDWGRDEDAETLLREAEAQGIRIDDVDRHVPYLLHAEVSAAGIRAAFPGIDAGIVDAVACHTFGRIGMTPLDKVVYIADSIEPKRHSEGVDDLRAMANACSLDEVFVATYAKSLASVIERHRPIHPGTAEVWNWIVTEAGAQ
jgi:predicted HD superfamily hydrolase involved in NAD metabolism